MLAVIMAAEEGDEMVAENGEVGVDVEATDKKVDAAADGEMVAAVGVGVIVLLAIGTAVQAVAGNFSRKKFIFVWFIKFFCNLVLEAKVSREKMFRRKKNGVKLLAKFIGKMICVTKRNHVISS